MKKEGHRSVRVQRFKGHYRKASQLLGALLPPMSQERLQSYWRELARRYFDDRLLPIRIEWSTRLTASAGLFVSLVGPRAHHGVIPSSARGRVIRLSVPLLANQPEHEILRTLGHEMIHQWQYDVRRCRPSHGRDFRDKMEEMNRDGLGITIRHTLNDRVNALAKYAWRCLQCGTVYQRQRRTISPRSHRCGFCHGVLKEDTVDPNVVAADPWWTTQETETPEPARKRSQVQKPIQLDFNFLEDSA